MVTAAISLMVGERNLPMTVIFSCAGAGPSTTSPFCEGFLHEGAVLILPALSMSATLSACMSLTFKYSANCHAQVSAPYLLLQDSFRSPLSMASEPRISAVVDKSVVKRNRLSPLPAADVTERLRNSIHGICGYVTLTEAGLPMEVGNALHVCMLRLKHRPLQPAP